MNESGTNNRHSTLLRALCAAAVSIGWNVGAAAASDEHREHGAHAHGHGVLEVAAEGDELEIALRIPAVNAVGFEHAPTTAEQKQRVEETVARFQRGERLFVASTAAACRLVEADVDLMGMEEEHHEEHEHESHEKEAHGSDKHDEHDNHGEHDKHGEHDEHMEEGHAELRAEYHFRCEDIGRLEAIEVNAFDALSDVEEIEASVVTETYQGAAELTAGERTLKLAR